MTDTAIVNFAFSALITFYVTFLFAYLLSKAVRPPRMRYYLLISPVINLSLLLVSFHSGWMLEGGHSILHALEGSRNLGVFLYADPLPSLGILTSFASGARFSLGDLLAELWGTSTLMLAGLLVLGTALSLLSFVCKGMRGALWVMKHRKGRITLSPEIEQVFVAGLFRPTIFFPLKLYAALTTEERKAILTHERSHVRWLDTLLHPLIGLVGAIFWFIPFKKRILKRSSLFRELSCDLAYGNALVTASALRKTLEYRGMARLAFSSGQSLRVRVLLSPVRRHCTVLGIIVLVGGLVFVMRSSCFAF